MVYYGTLDRFKDQAFSTTTMLCIRNSSTALVQFTSKEEAVWHGSLYNKCKKLIDDVREAVGLSVSGFNQTLFKDR